MQKAYFFDLLSDLFNFYSLEQAYKRLLRMLDEDLYKLYPKLLTEYKLLEPHIKEKIVEVAHRFRNQYTRLIRTRSCKNGFVPVRCIFIKSWNLFVFCLQRLIYLLIIGS